ncbi:TPA: hypothetical protein EYO12_03830 [Candidatus Saccharibacteria bacterium]|nr:hypothetical protein [Candidatus Saccharibacteria bacterium]HIO87831.1 hypothetical protein [Candidatus Saccharibacteria bacterium]
MNPQENQQAAQPAQPVFTPENNPVTQPQPVPAQNLGQQQPIPQPQQAFQQPQIQQQPAPQNQQPQTTHEQPKPTNPNSTQNSLQIAEIRDGIVIMKDGSYRAVVLAQSINFDLMSPQERGGVESAYQGFLNSLYFQVQITMRSRKVDLRNYLNKLNTLRENQDNILLGLLMEDYLAYIEYLSQTANIMDKQFFVIVPFEPTAHQNITNKAGKFTAVFNRKTPTITINEEDLIKAKTELKNRVQAVLESMNQMGVQAIPLNTQELIELYYDVYNPDTATTQPLSSSSGVEQPYITRGEGDAPRPDLKENLF